MENLETTEDLTETVDLMKNFTLEEPGDGSVIEPPKEVEEPDGGKQKEPQQEPVNIEVPNVETEEPSGDGGNEHYYNDVFDTFRELGYLEDVEPLAEGKVLTNDELVEIIKENKQKAAQKIFEEEIMSKFDDPDAKDYLDYILKGGRSEDFFKQRMSSPALGIDGDIEDERVQDKVIAKYLSEFTGMDDADIAEQLQMLKDSGKKEKYAKMYKEKIHQFDEAQKETMRKERELIEQQQKEQYQKTIDAFSVEVKATENIFGVKCDETKRKKIMDMIFKPMKLQDGSVNTEFNVRLAMAVQNPKKAIILADLLANDFDVTKYTKSFETKATQNIRAGLSKPPKR